MLNKSCSQMQLLMHHIRLLYIMLCCYHATFNVMAYCFHDILCQFRIKIIKKPHENTKLTYIKETLKTGVSTLGLTTCLLYYAKNHQAKLKSCLRVTRSFNEAKEGGKATLKQNPRTETQYRQSGQLSIITRPGHYLTFSGHCC